MQAVFTRHRLVDPSVVSKTSGVFLVVVVKRNEGMKVLDIWQA